MKKINKFFFIISLVGVAIGGYALTKYLTRNTKRVQGGVIRKVTFEEASQGVVFD